MRVKMADFFFKEKNPRKKIAREQFWSDSFFSLSQKSFVLHSSASVFKTHIACKGRKFSVSLLIKLKGINFNFSSLYLSHN